MSIELTADKDKYTHPYICKNDFFGNLEAAEASYEHKK